MRGIKPRTVFAVLLALSFSHLLNDMMQSLIPAVYPILKTRFQLSFTQIGLITLTFQLTASLLQPLVGLYTDRHPKPYSLAIGMGFTLVGLLLLSQAGNFPAILLAAGLVGVGSSVFHPESSRVARLASGGRHGLAQSLFQVGGNAGGAIGPLLARSSSFREDKPASPGSRRPLSWPCSSCSTWESGTAVISRPDRSNRLPEPAKVARSCRGSRLPGPSPFCCASSFRSIVTW